MTKSNEKCSIKNYFWYETILRRIGLKNVWLLPIPWLLGYVVISFFSFSHDFEPEDGYVVYSLIWLGTSFFIAYSAIVFRHFFFKKINFLYQDGIISQTTHVELVEFFKFKKIWIVFLGILAGFVISSIVGLTLHPTFEKYGLPAQYGNFYLLLILIPAGSQIFSFYWFSLYKLYKISKTNLNLKLRHPDGYGGIKLLDPLILIASINFLIITTISSIQTDVDVLVSPMFYYNACLSSSWGIVVLLFRFQIRDALVSIKENWSLRKIWIIPLFMFIFTWIRVGYDVLVQNIGCGSFTWKQLGDDLWNTLYLQNPDYVIISIHYVCISEKLTIG